MGLGLVWADLFPYEERKIYWTTKVGYVRIELLTGIVANNGL